MRPEYKVDIPHIYDGVILDLMVEWLLSNVGEPYPFDEEETSYKRLDWEANGKWACIAGSNKYNNPGHNRLLDTWWFAEQDDAVLFKLTWS